MRKFFFVSLQWVRATLPVVVVMLACLSESHAWARGCDPDLSTQDSITKAKIVQWRQELGSSGMMNTLMSGENMTFTVFVTRMGNKNYITIRLNKIESNDRRAVFESQYHAEKGNKIIFGFKGGEPVSLDVTDASNQAKTGAMTGDLNMNVQWDAEVSDRSMAAFRDALTTKPIEAFRIILGSGQIDRAVDDKNGKRVMEKFNCFYQFFDTTGASLQAGGGSQNQPAQPVSGAISTAGANSAPPHANAASEAALTNESVVKLVKLDLGDAVVIAKIKQAAVVAFKLDTDDLIKLKEQGVSKEVIAAMLNRATPPR